MKYGTYEYLPLEDKKEIKIENIIDILKPIKEGVGFEEAKKLIQEARLELDLLQVSCHEDFTGKFK